MPFVHARINRPYTADAAEKFKSDMGKAITAFPGKSESWLMVETEQQQLWFRGTDEPAAAVNVSVFGSLNESSCEKMTGLICESVSRNFGVPADRIYVRYDETGYWGWNGSNF